MARAEIADPRQSASEKHLRWVNGLGWGHQRDGGEGWRILPILAHSRNRSRPFLFAPFARFADLATRAWLAEPHEILWLNPNPIPLVHSPADVQLGMSIPIKALDSKCLAQSLAKDRPCLARHPLDARGNLD